MISRSDATKIYATISARIGETEESIRGTQDDGVKKMLAGDLDHLYARLDLYNTILDLYWRIDTLKDEIQDLRDQLKDLT